MPDTRENNLDLPSTAAPGSVVAAPRLQHRPVSRSVESIDTFSLADSPVVVEEQVLTEDEPSVFGGANPPPPSPAEIPVVGQMQSDLVGAVIDEPLSAADLLGETPKIDVQRIVKSTPFLIACMVVLLIAATIFIRNAVPTETFVETRISFVNYARLDDHAKQELQLEINRLIRTFPLRQKAWEMLQKRSPDLRPGFLSSGLTFHRLDALTWEPDGTLRVRIDSTETADDLVRFDSLIQVFYTQALARNIRRDESRQQISDAAARQSSLQQTDAALKDRINELLQGAQRYMDLKAALQATERFLDVTDESNPLRLVARQNLHQLATRVSDARGIAVERDEKLTARVNVQKEIDALTVEMARLRNYVDTFPYPSEPDAKNITVVDTRPHLKAVLRRTWIGLIVLFAALVAWLHYLEHRIHSGEREARRQRRRTVADQPAAK